MGWKRRSVFVLIVGDSLQFFGKDQFLGRPSAFRLGFRPPPSSFNGKY